jgi:hypothetical protein
VVITHPILISRGPIASKATNLRWPITPISQETWDPRSMSQSMAKLTTSTFLLSTWLEMGPQWSAATFNLRHLAKVKTGSLLFSASISQFRPKSPSSRSLNLLRLRSLWAKELLSLLSLKQMQKSLWFRANSRTTSGWEEAQIAWSFRETLRNYQTRVQRSRRRSKSALTGLQWTILWISQGSLSEESGVQSRNALITPI